MTRLKNRAPATDSPSASTSPLSSGAKDTKLKGTRPEKTALAHAAAAPSQKTSGWRRLGRAIKRHPNVSQTLLFLTLIGGTSAVLLTLLFKDAWSDRYNNVAVLRTILKMELSREDARILDDSPERVITHTFRTLEPHVEADGWTWINRFGNTITYGKQDQRMIASCSPYSPLYMICDLGEIPK